MKNHWKIAAFFVSALVGSMPLSAFADDPVATPDHSGKQVDGKTNGVTPPTATTVQKQEKEQPAVKGEAAPIETPAAGAMK